jgi:hypothetical protein
LKLKTFIPFLLTVSSITTIYWINYQLNWLRQASFIIPGLVLVTLGAGLLLKNKTGYKNLAWGLIYGSLTCLVLLVVRILFDLLLIAGM